MSKKWIAMLLAGGQGTRLNELTTEIAKPAVPFGGKYRIIDFTLSNCTHSGIDTVGVLTQYEPHVLNDYVKGGRAWDLDRTYGGVSVLPPYKAKDGGHWYKGTANAVFQNIQFIDKYDPEHVLVISGDHIYKMDYTRLLHYHIEKGADASIAVIRVPWSEATRFGIMNTNDSGKIIDFEEKPTFPRSNLASMGVYLFNWKMLKSYLLEDEENQLSSNDFGKDIIPKMLADQGKLYAYQFNGYWKDVGTVESLWEANMDLLEDSSGLKLDDPYWKIYAGNANHPPQYISKEARVTQSLVNEGSLIYGNIQHSVVSYDVQIGAGSVITDSVIMPNVKIGKNVRIERAIIASNTVIEDGTIIGPSALTNEISLFGNWHCLSENMKKVIGGEPRFPHYQ
ncbi:glucose-1-phosphate adenylyltransferase [Bacillus niameyensis]|uniref:glucose-1-phosphate adenylyltransferase n=1 Tax=Bacillus niameyensis TaxID=1522308 RepID=UPI000781F666|nr:glucose-1-phosphate adenylyltransferase [Bacillus niameyensis]